MSRSKPVLGTSSSIFAAMRTRLTTEGRGLYEKGPGPKPGQADSRAR
ncbi:hypothetical protein [Streptomyces sp. NPDC055107]